MSVTLRNMTSVYIFKDDKVLLLYRQGGRVVNDVWTGSAGGHFENYELNNPESCVLREMKEELGMLFLWICGCLRWTDWKQHRQSVPWTGWTLRAYRSSH